MSYSVGAAITAGIVTGIVTGLFLLLVLGFLPRPRLSALAFLGSYAPLHRALAVYPVGAVAFLVLSAVFGLAHAGLYHAFDIQGTVLAWGLVFGLAHWLVDGLLLVPAAELHPQVRAGETPNPGAFALSYPTASPLMFLALHVVYGVLVGSLYDSLR